MASDSSLRDWLAGGGWVRHFGKAVVGRAADYANPSTIRDLEWDSEDTPGHHVIDALVSGSARSPYHTSVFLTASNGEWDVDVDCTCPMGFGCKHGAAVMLYLQQLTGSGPPAKPVRPKTPAAAPPDPLLLSWLREIAAAVRTEPVKAKPDAPNPKFLAYCIERPAPPASPNLRFVLRVGTRKKDGTVSIPYSTATADPGNPPKYMVREDVMLATFFRQRQNYSNWGDVRIQGPRWDDLLDGALATGRVYYGEELRYGNVLGYRPVTEGPPEAVEAVWDTLPNGSVKPVLRGIRADLIVLPTVPARYIDPVNGVLGLAESSLPPAILAAWEKGPVVKPAHIAELTNQFATVSSIALPMPVSVEIETRQAQPPTPILRVRKWLSPYDWSRTESLIGELAFQYGDSPRLHPLSSSAPREHSAMVNGKRIVWPRDFKAERAAEALLKSHGLRSLSEVAPQNALDTASRHAVIPEHPGPMSAITWLTLLESPGFESLRDAGWIIETDPKAGLTTREATEFVPAIEADPDHGIDWFRFDIAYEIEGRRFSLIPLIAQAIAMNLPPADSPDLPEFIALPCENPEDGFVRFPARRLMEIVDQVRHLFHGRTAGDAFQLDRLAAANVAAALAIDSSETTRSLARLGKSLRDIHELPEATIPDGVRAELRPYQQLGFRWLQFLASHGLHGILADDMGLGKTLQTLAHLAAETAKSPGRPSLVIAPTSVVPNWAAEAARFVPDLKVVVLHGSERKSLFDLVAGADLVVTSYPLLTRDHETLAAQEWHVLVLDEAQYIKNPKAIATQCACKLTAAHRLCLSGTPMENHLGEFWSLMRFLMPGFLGDEKSFNSTLRKPIERDRSRDAQLALNRRVSPLVLRRTKDEVANELPAKTEIIHHVDLGRKQADLYESVRASMDARVREAIAAQGLAKSHIIVLDALLKLRQICCHPVLLKSEAAKKVQESAKFDYLVTELLPTLLEEGRRILLFSQFTSMLSLIEAHLAKEDIPFLKLTGQTKERGKLVETFQAGEVPVFLISLKAGGTGLNLTAADTVIHYDPWWNPAAENQATDRAHRIGQTKPVFVHKLVCRGTIEDRILELQKHKAALVEALLSEETTALKIDAETLGHLLAPLE